MPQIPAKLILDPLAPIPATMGKRDRHMLAQLRAAYTESMQERFVGAQCNVPEATAALLAPICASLSVEQLIVVGLDARLRAVAPPVVISRGDTDGTDAPIRACLRAVLVMESVSWLVAHNHPTGDPGPSAGDQAVTRTMVAASRTIQCPLQDHIIIGSGGRFTSLRREMPDLWR